MIAEALEKYKIFDLVDESIKKIETEIRERIKNLKEFSNFVYDYSVHRDLILDKIKDIKNFEFRSLVSGVFDFKFNALKIKLDFEGIYLKDEGIHNRLVCLNHYYTPDFYHNNNSFKKYTESLKKLEFLREEELFLRNLKYFQELASILEKSKNTSFIFPEDIKHLILRSLNELLEENKNNRFEYHEDESFHNKETGRNMELINIIFESDYN